MEDYKLGEEFQVGRVTLKCVLGEGCEECYFRPFSHCKNVIKLITGACGKEQRKDVTDVIFKIVK